VIVGTLGFLVVVLVVVVVVVVVGRMFQGGILLFWKKSIGGGIARAIIIIVLCRTILMLMMLGMIIMTFDNNPSPMRIAKCDIFERTNNTVFVIETAARKDGCHQQQETDGLVPPFRRRHHRHAFFVCV
jgi:hypothetical protein